MEIEIIKQSIIFTKIEENLNDDLKKIEELREMARIRDPKTCLSPKSWMSISEAESNIKEALFAIKKAKAEAGNEMKGEVLTVNPPYGKSMM